MKLSAQIDDLLGFAVGDAIRKASSALLAKQAPEGYWWADLRADTTLESDYILMELWLNPPVNGVWNPPTRGKIMRAVDSILARQLDDGGFNIYLHGPSEVNASIKAYFALKVAGLPTADERMRKLRERILALGGLQAANSYVRTNLSLFNLFPRDACPSIPPEIILLPFKFIYQMSSWTRAIVLSLSIVHAANPGRPVPAGFTLDELFVPGAPLTPPRDKKLFSWRNFFLLLDRMLKAWEKLGLHFVRERATKKCLEWMIEHFEASDGLGAIYPSMQYAIMALDVMGYPPNHPLRAEAEKHFNYLMVDDERGFYMQPCFSPVWDTAIASFALAEADTAPADKLRRTADWLISKEIRRKGDWSVKRPDAEPSGWAFEFNNGFYPDVDDTAMVLLALQGLEASDTAAQRACIKRAIDWLLTMQGKDGGWAAFDVDNDWKILSHVPFADHNAMLDPSCPDITGRVLEALIGAGLPKTHPAIRRGVEYLLGVQEADGSWYGRWGVNYLYGTFLALRGLRAAGLSENEPPIQQAIEFVRAYQNRDGGWGESCSSYDEGRFMPNPSTPSQTAWAILALLAGGDTRSESLHNGVDYLVRTQRADGNWNEEYCTGTGFPRVFYLEYTDYRHTFPLLALSQYRKVMSESPERLATGMAAGTSSFSRSRREEVPSYARAFDASAAPIATPGFPPLSKSANV
ncbi:MAG TPA: squalene--hopene cyclase [Bryobacteraceae bacterium]|jgi:squalene-hopene/tetraprenyl-beta-curcumene cyclase|nr:squalene--hopene cyclase [Bryobacteraceae bacterium]